MVNMQLFWPVFVAVCFFAFRAFSCPLLVEDLSSLKQLNTYANEWPGLYHDHFTTTWTHTSHPNALNRYNFVETLGMVLTDNKKCTCAVEVIQLIDEQMGFGGSLGQPGLFGRINHKMVLKRNRPSNSIDNYFLTGESFYCVTKYGQCGASIPLREWHVEAEYDTIMTTNTSMAQTLGVTFKGILCYIWPGDYRANTLAPFGKGQPDEKKSIGGVDVIQEPECPPLNTTNGGWTFNALRRVPGTVGTLHCNLNHGPSNGSPVVVCQKTHKWMPNPATSCTECKKCTALHAGGQNAQLDYSEKLVEDEEESTEFYPIGTTASLVCSNQTGVSEHLADISVCTAQGWVPPKLGYCEKLCPPFEVKNGQILYTNGRGFDQNSYTNGTIATIVCQPSARLINGSSAICINGEWSSKLGDCEWPTCKPVESIENGHLLYSVAMEGTPLTNTTLHYPGTTVRLHCSPAHSIHGASESVCMAHGKWEPTIGHCH